jgi:hypothetical protein
MAGRSTAGGGACSCGDANCITEPGECGGNLNGATPGDAGAVVLILALGLAFWLRLRS